MPDTDKAVRIVADYESGFLSWEETYRRLLDIGTPEYVIRETIGKDPEEF